MDDSRPTRPTRKEYCQKQYHKQISCFVVADLRSKYESNRCGNRRPVFPVFAEGALCHSPVISGKLQMELPTSYKRTSGPWRVSHLPEGIFLKTNQRHRLELLDGSVGASGSGSYQRFAAENLAGADAGG